MDVATRGRLQFAAAHLVFVVGLLHLLLGLVNWLRWLQGGFLVPRDVRWPVFVASGLAVLVGILVARRASNRRPYYAGGVVVMLGYVVGYFGWHLGGHRPLLVLGPAAAHDAVDLQWFLDHLFAGAVETAAIFVEVLAAVALLVLFLTE